MIAIRRTAALLTLAVLVSSLGCDQNAVQKAATANKDFINALAAAQQTEIQFHNPCTSPDVPSGCGEIDDSLHITFQREFKALAQCSDAAGQAFGANNKVGAQTALNTCSTSLQNLITTGAAGVKNANSKAALTGILFSMQTAVNTALAFLK